MILGKEGSENPEKLGVLKVKKIIIWRHVHWLSYVNEPTVLSRNVIETFRNYTKYSMNASLIIQAFQKFVNDIRPRSIKLMGLRCAYFS